MSKLDTLVKIFSDDLTRFDFLTERGFCDHLSDEAFIRLKYRYRMGEELNLKNPQTYNEKLQWLKLNEHNKRYVKLVDKYSVKQYIERKIGAEYVIPALGVWDGYNDIDFSALPDQFVLKCTHDSGSTMVVKNKNNMNHKAIKKYYSKKLKRNYYYMGREWPYKYVYPRIIAEAYLKESDLNKRSGRPVNDYKVLCFEGVPRLIEVHQGRFEKKHYQDFYDTDWNKLDIGQAGELNSPHKIARPEQLEEMLSLSEKLSKGFHHIRVDWYIAGGKLLFGELTFYDGAGFVPFIKKSDDMLLGSWIEI